MNVDWGSLRAVVLESDDWGLCAWVPDEQGHRALADAPPWRSPAGRVYGRSTLETADDVRRLAELLAQTRGADSMPAVWQANTIMAAPDYERLEPPLFPVEDLPLVELPDAPSRWRRPGLWPQVRRSMEEGVWWPELHGLHHLPADAWLRALRRGSADARRAHVHQILVCEAVEASGEYDPREPRELRTRTLDRAVEIFRRVFGRAPASICPPDYRWDDALERDAGRNGIAVLQGKAEQAGSFPRLRRALHSLRWPQMGSLFAMPPRIAFEPRGGAEPGGPVGAAAALQRVRRSWARSQPAVISSHRVNYAHLDPEWSEAGRMALRELLSSLVADGARFLTDAEVLSLCERGWSTRAIGPRRTLVRSYVAERETLRVETPAHSSGFEVREARGAGIRPLADGERVALDVDRGEYLIEWR